MTAQFLPSFPFSVQHLQKIRNWLTTMEIIVLISSIIIIYYYWYRLLYSNRVDDIYKIFFKHKHTNTQTNRLSVVVLFYGPRSGSGFCHSVLRVFSDWNTSKCSVTILFLLEQQRCPFVYLYCYCRS